MRHLKKKKSFYCTLAVWGFALIAGSAQANVFLTGTAAGRPGDEVVFSLGVTAGTTLDGIAVLPYYEDFASILRLVDFQATSALTDLTEYGLGHCIEGEAICTFVYLPGKFFPEDAVLATWRFNVASNALDLVDPTSHGRVAFDLGVYIGSIHVPSPQDQVFTVLAAPMIAVPEPSSFGLTALGALLLIAGRHWRRPHAGRSGGPACGPARRQVR